MGSNPLEGGQFQRRQVTGSPFQAHTVPRVVNDGGVALIGPQRSLGQPCGVPLVVTEGGFVLFAAEQQLVNHRLAEADVVDVDLGRLQLGMFGTDRPEQPAQAGLLEVGTLAGPHRLGIAGHDIQPGGFADCLGQLPGDAHEVADVIGSAVDDLLCGAAGARRGDHDDAARKLLSAR